MYHEMRVGFNPNKDKRVEASNFIHQVVIPVYIPNQEGYFKDSFKILELCIASLLNTIHDKTFITIINNGGCNEIKIFLDKLLEEKKIHELIHTENIGKLNAIIKGLVGNNIELVTISDADVLFLPSWQQETAKVFHEVPRAGVVGIVPQFKMYEANCGNVIFDNVFNKKLKFLSIKNPEALKKFYKSISWDNNYNNDYLKYSLGLEINSNLSVLIGSGHFVATYKKDIFSEVTSFIAYKMGSASLSYLDRAPLKKDYWRLTTLDNFAYHMGNTYEDWMEVDKSLENNNKSLFSNFKINKNANKVIYFLKNRLFFKIIFTPIVYKLFLKIKGLPKKMVNQY